MFPLLILLVFLAPTDSYETCKTSLGKVGKCVLINHCPHFFMSILNQTQSHQNNITKEHAQKSHCGFESILFPKVCCPIELVKLYQENHGSVSRRGLKCGLHSPEGEQDPWIALIEYETPGRRSYLCGGVLIHKRHILTPAHCIQGRNLPKTAKLVNVRFGNYDPEFLPLLVQIEDTIVHEDYNPFDPNYQNDIALVRLKKKISFRNGAIKPICLPTNKPKKIGESLPLAGWERSGNDSAIFIKRAGIATLMNNSVCDNVYNVTLGESQICAGGRKNSRVGQHRIDMGGVLVEVGGDTSYSLVGLTSLKPPCCDREEYPRVYTKVSSYINWIFSNLDS